MTNCINCGKKIGMFDKVNKLIQSDNEMFCDKCYEILSKDYDIINDATNPNDIYENAKNHLLELAHNNNFSEKTLDYIDRFISLIEIRRSKTKQISQDDYQIGYYEEQLSIKTEKIFKKLSYNEFKNHLITTGYNFEGYKINEYLGIVNGNSALGSGLFSSIPATFSDITGESSNAISKKLQTAKNIAIKKIVSQSIAIGGNAIIGVSISYSTIFNNLLCVVATGTSVVIEKNESNE